MEYKKLSLTNKQPYEKMHNSFFGNFIFAFKQSPIAGSSGGILGWVCSLFLLDTPLLTWDFLIRGTVGLLLSGTGILFGLVIKDFYALKIKNKLFKPKQNDSRADKAA